MHLWTRYVQVIRLKKGRTLITGMRQARARFDAAAEELEKVLLQKQGESIKDPSNFAHAFPATSPGTGSGATSITGTNKRTFGKAMSKLKGPKSMAQAAKQEDEVRSKMGQSSDSYRGQVLGAQAIRNEYFNLQLPRILRVSFVPLSDTVYLCKTNAFHPTRSLLKTVLTKWTWELSTTWQDIATCTKAPLSTTASQFLLSTPKTVSFTSLRASRVIAANFCCKRLRTEGCDRRSRHPRRFQNVYAAVCSQLANVWPTRAPP